MNKHGFTLLELVISISILLIVSVLGGVAMRAATVSVAVASAKAEVQDDVRDVMDAMKRELSLASKKTDNSLNPPLVALAITQNPAPGSPVQVTFQVPLDGTGKVWSRPITYRYVDEDTNKDARLNSGEDADADGALTRRIVRIQDMNNNGSTNDPGEQRPLGGANDLSNATFTMNGNVLTISLTATRLMSTRRDHPARVTVSTNVYPQN